MITIVLLFNDPPDSVRDRFMKTFALGNFRIDDTKSRTFSAENIIEGSRGITLF